MKLWWPTVISPHSEIHFYIRLGCNREAPNVKTHPILLQYSVDGGITWQLIAEIPFTEPNHLPNNKVALEIPFQALTNSTRLRWWQPSRDGEYLEDWAIDQVINLIFFSQCHNCWTDNQSSFAIRGERMKYKCYTTLCMISFVRNVSCFP